MIIFVLQSYDKNQDFQKLFMRFEIIIANIVLNT